MNKVDGFLKKEENIACFQTFDVIDKKIYGHLIWKNILTEINPDSEEISLKMLDDTYFYKHCIADDKKIYFADNLGRALMIYDLASESREEYKLDSYIREDNNIVTIENYAEYIIIVENYRGIIYNFNKEKKIIEIDDSVLRRLKQKSEDTVKNIYCWRIKDYLYLRIILKDSYEDCWYDLKKKCLENIRAPRLPDNIVNAYSVNDRLYVLQDNNNVIVWNVNSDEINGLCQVVEKSKYAFSSIAVTKKNIWLLPSTYGRDIYIYDISNKRMSRYDGYPIDFYYLDVENWSKYSDIKERDGYIYVAARLSNYYLVINVEDGTGIWKPAYVKDYNEYYNYYMSLLEVRREKITSERCIPLKYFLVYLKKGSQNLKEMKKAGEEIWRKIV